MHRIGAQFVALDSAGVWYGLRLAPDGKGPGLEIPIFGGLRGDVPITPGSGALVADVIVDQTLTAIVDTSQFEHDSEKNRFVADFAARLFFRKKASPSAIHVFLEESQEYLPQNIQKGEERMLHHLTRMIRIGRNFGIGASMITQRPQDVNKKALYQAEVVLAFQLTGPLEIDAVAYWTKEKGFKDDLRAILPKLEVGHAHLWSPVLLKANREIHISPRKTFPAGQTPKVGAKVTVRARDLKPLEIEALMQQMAATIELAKADDPKALKQRIAELEMAAKKVKVSNDTGEIAKLRGELARAHASRKELEADVVELKKVIEKARLALAIALPAQSALPTETDSQAIKEQRPIPARIGKPEPVQYHRDTAQGREARQGGELPKGERVILTAIAQHTEEGVSREQLTVLTGYKRSSRDTYLQRLAARGLTVENGDGIQATPEGIEALGDRFQPLPTGAALREHHLHKLPAGEREVLRVVLGSYPESITRDEISEAVGYKRSSRDTYLQRLNSRKLVTFPKTGLVRASDGLF
jgi:hypothetical protein